MDSSPGSHCIIKRSLFASNSGSAAGGALFHTATTAYIENSVFTANSSGGGLQSGVAAGAIRGFTSAPGRFWITNCTFSANTNTRGTAGAISLFAPNDGNSMLANSIVVGSGSNPVTFPTAPAHLLSDQTIAGTENVVGTPTFVNSGNALGVDGVFGTRDDGFVLTAASPGVDSASAAVAPLIDATGVSRPQGAGVERGAYETLVPPQISTQPQSISVAQGAPGTLQVSHTGVGPFSYQWMKDGVNIPGATADNYSIGSIQPWHIGNYVVTVTNSEGQATSNTATISVTDIASGIWQGLMAYYPFNGNADDESVNGNDGAVIGASLIQDRYGNAAKAYAFSGSLNPLWSGRSSRYIQVPDSPSLRPEREVTVSLWAKASTNQLQDSPHMFTKRINIHGGGPYNSWALATQGHGHLGLIWGAEGRNTLTGNDILDGSWQHIVLTIGRTNMSMFLNGVKIGDAQTGDNPFQYSSESLLIGTAKRDSFQEWYGALDDIRIYNRALSSAEVQELNDLEDPDSDDDGIKDRFETGTGIYVSPTNTGTNPLLADTDGDGLNDGIEITQHGSNPNLKDSDSDGFEDGFEVLTGFNPASAASTPEALSSMLPAVEFRFNAANGVSYRIESSPDLAGWSTIENNILGAGVPVVRFYTTDGITRRFYRARRN